MLCIDKINFPTYLGIIFSENSPSLGYVHVTSLVYGMANGQR